MAIGDGIQNREDIKLYYISDKAYHMLTSTATQQRYIKYGAIKKKGLSEFLTDLCYMKFTDTRPAEIIRRHDIMIANGRAPIWTSYPVRRTRALALPKPTIERYMRVALQVGIIKEEPYIVGGPSKLRPTSVVGYVLEGLGLGWITPNRFPIKREAFE